MWGAIIGAGIGLAGTIFSARQAAAGQASANALNIELARQNREFQEYSYKHRYQWTMQDLRAAGLNPMLAASNGVGGSLSGSVIPVQNVYGQAAQITSSGVGEAISSAVDVYRAGTEGELRGAEVAKVGAELHKIAAEVAQISASTDLTREQKENAIAERQRIWAEYFLANAKVDLTTDQQKLLRSQVAINKWVEIYEQVRSEISAMGVPRAQAEADLYQSTYGRFLHWLERSKDAINPFGGSGIAAPLRSR